MKLLDWLFVPRRWKKVLICLGMLQLIVAFIRLNDGDRDGWLHVGATILFFAFALREHEKMTK